MSALIPVEVIAEALAKHGWVPDAERVWERLKYVLYGKCSGCGKWSRTAEEHAAHQASVIAALPDIAIVALPEPDTDDRGVRHWEVGDISVVEGTGVVWADLEPTVHHHATAQIVAANLLSAANFAHRPAAGGES